MRCIHGARVIALLFWSFLLASAYGASNSELKPNDNIAVEGVFYCRCNLTGYDKSIDASPLPGAKTVLKCKVGDEYEANVDAVTDSRGYFLIQASTLAKYAGHICRLHVASSPLTPCTVPPHLAVDGPGAKLIFERIRREGPYKEALFSAGLLIFGPTKSTWCPKHY